MKHEEAELLATVFQDYGFEVLVGG
jgi:hypothetical protein